MMQALLTVLIIVGCGDTASTEEPVLLETVSQEITFDSVDRLGPHHSISTIQTIETRDRETVLESTQTIEIAWNSWSSFHFQRFVDSDPTFEAINHEGSSAVPCVASARGSVSLLAMDEQIPGMQKG